jgi:hypothetical protein
MKCTRLNGVRLPMTRFGRLAVAPRATGHRRPGVVAGRPFKCHWPPRFARKNVVNVSNGMRSTRS